VDTIVDLADKYGLRVHTVDGLRDWYRRADPEVDLYEFCRRHWADRNHRYADGESLCRVEERNIGALERILRDCEGQNVIVGTHGMALSVIVSHYDPHFGYGEFMRLLPLMPLIVKMTFDGERCVGIEQIEINEMRGGR
jgi:2,3-bisphosphoglycerate-dependent phosphoglycerate mutase